MSGPPVARMLLGAALVSAAIACDGDGSPRLQGRWKGVRAEGVAPAASASANAFAAGMVLEIKGDAIEVTTPKEKQSGRYRVAREDKTSIVVTTDKDGPNEPQTFTFVDDKTLRWAVASGQTIVFVRQ